jgi:hypothetical protein
MGSSDEPGRTAPLVPVSIGESMTETICVVPRVGVSGTPATPLGRGFGDPWPPPDSSSEPEASPYSRISKVPSSFSRTCVTSRFLGSGSDSCDEQGFASHETGRCFFSPACSGRSASGRRRTAARPAEGADKLDTANYRSVRTEERKGFRQGRKIAPRNEPACKTGDRCRDQSTERACTFRLARAPARKEAPHRWCTPATPHLHAIHRERANKRDLGVHHHDVVVVVICSRRRRPPASAAKRLVPGAGLTRFADGSSLCDPAGRVGAAGDGVEAGTGAGAGDGVADCAAASCTALGSRHRILWRSQSCLW